jgi:hypothetical protein
VTEVPENISGGGESTLPADRDVEASGDVEAFGSAETSAPQEGLTFEASEDKEAASKILSADKMTKEELGLVKIVFGNILSLDAVQAEGGDLAAYNKKGQAYDPLKRDKNYMELNKLLMARGEAFLG